MLPECVSLDGVSPTPQPLRPQGAGVQGNSFLPVSDSFCALSKSDLDSGP